MDEYTYSKNHSQKQHRKEVGTPYLGCSTEKGRKRRRIWEWTYVVFWFILLWWWFFYGR